VSASDSSRRIFLFGMGTSLVWLPSCGRPPETPLAHLYGQEWVHKSYEMYGDKYVAVQTGAETSTQNAYKVLAQKGVTALDALQTRDVPFFMRVDASAKGFAIERHVPERLMFRAGMSDADRQTATAEWEKAREFIHSDYEEIRRLNWALTTLLEQLQSVRAAIENGKLEQYELVRQLAVLGEGEKPPFELPYQVSVKDYEAVLVLLLERLDDDKKRLARVETDIVAVGLTARSTDAGSASLAAGIQKVLLAVIEDSEATSPRASAYPQEQDKREPLLARGRELYQSIKAMPEYVAWEKHERTKELEKIGAFLQVVDMMTGLHTSAIYKQVLAVWTGDADYLSYVKTALGLLPFGGKLMAVVNEAVEYTEKARKLIETARKALNTAEDVMATVKRAQDAMKSGDPLRGVDVKNDLMKATKDAGLLNVGSKFALSKLDRQISFFKDRDEVKKVKEAMSQTRLMSAALPSIPALPIPSDAD
jgi:hypothetical protein